MQITSVETTPNPNSMKLNTDQHFTTGTYNLSNCEVCPPLIKPLLIIEGVESLFVSSQFITVNRKPQADWEIVLADVAKIIDNPQMVTQRSEGNTTLKNTTLGEVRVLVQTFRSIPMQVKVTDGQTEKRLSLSPRFLKAARELQAHFGAAFIQERQWIDQGIRYGELDIVAQEVLEEIEGVQSEAVLEKIKNDILGTSPSINLKQSVKQETQADIKSQNWHERLRALEQLEAPEQSIDLLVSLLLEDPQPQIRRWVAARLGTLELAVKDREKVVSTLCQALNDSSVGVRRTAGDSLSDIGDPSAEAAVCEALKDKNKLVRWRAARFLAEAGTPDALTALESALDEPEYEVLLEIKAAITHIQNNSKQAGPVWKQMKEASH